MFSEAFEQYSRSLAFAGMAATDLAQLKQVFAKFGMPGYFRTRIEQLAQLAPQRTPAHGGPYD
jgi:hypothetical protein